MTDHVGSTLSAPTVEEALQDVPLFRKFAGLGGWDDRLPDESPIRRFCHVLETRQLGQYHRHLALKDRKSVV